MLSRRMMMGAVCGGFFGQAFRSGCHAGLARQPEGRARRCVVLWMQGGPSQFETFDPKAGTASGGETGILKTAVPGLAISDTLPRMAQRIKDLAVIRNLSHGEGDHFRGQHYLHTGFPLVPAFPRPAAGAVLSRESPDRGFPNYVSIGAPGFGPAYMGPDHAPFAIQSPTEALELLREIRQRRSSIALLQELGAAFDNSYPAEAVQRRRAMITRVEQMVSTPFVEALDLSATPQASRERYGDTPFGRSCLLARRLLEVGVGFVEVQLDGWDTHLNNFPATRRLCQALDPAWAALMHDLRVSGLLDETLVVWMGEFGRTPNINAQRGRDHFPRVTPVVMAGAGIPGGQAIGSTDRLGMEIEGPAYNVADLFATIFSLLGIDPDREYTTSFGSPTTATDAGTVMREIVG